MCVDFGWRTFLFYGKNRENKNIKNFSYFFKKIYIYIMSENITLKDILETEPFTFTLSEIEQIMDEELSSPIDTMDTDLIDLCLDILTGEYFQKM